MLRLKDSLRFLMIRYPINNFRCSTQGCSGNDM